MWISISACSNNPQQNKININQLPPVSENANTGIFVNVSDPHIYSKKWPKALSGSYYFNPRKFYNTPKLSIFRESYIKEFDDKKVYYYDDMDCANAGIITYVLRNIYKRDNVSCLLNSKLKKEIKYKQKLYSLSWDFLNNVKESFTWGFIWTGKYLVVYDPSKINFKTGDLLLYASDKMTMENDDFFKKNKDKINIKNLYWSNLIDIQGWLKQNYKQVIKEKNLSNYNHIYIYYPKYWYRSGILALILEKK